VWETSEARRSSEGLLRVHCSKGWVSTHSRQGDELLRKHKLVLQETVLSAVRTILLDSGWAVPDASLDVGSASLGRRVFVEGYGIGNVVEFKRAAIGTSSHLLRLDNGLMVEVKLQRKGNKAANCAAWLVGPDDVGRSEGVETAGSGATRLQTTEGEDGSTLVRLSSSGNAESEVRPCNSLPLYTAPRTPLSTFAYFGYPRDPRMRVLDVRAGGPGGAPAAGAR
jgi:hypothetical protein